MSLAFDNGVGYQHHRLVSHFYLPDHSIEYLGSLGVKIFFVISGFVICRLLILDVHPA
jgi:peptidoglycan/LPS O-acetylase OafA/YrhL